MATESEDGQPVIEGRILERLLDKLERMRSALGDRVFDVIGEVLSLNKVNLPEMLRDVAYEPSGLDGHLDLIERIDPGMLERYERATGIALARAHVHFDSFAKANLEAGGAPPHAPVRRDALPWLPHGKWACIPKPAPMACGASTGLSPISDPSV